MRLKNADKRSSDKSFSTEAKLERREEEGGGKDGKGRWNEGREGNIWRRAGGWSKLLQFSSISSGKPSFLFEERLIAVGRQLLRPSANIGPETEWKLSFSRGKSGQKLSWGKCREELQRPVLFPKVADVCPSSAFSISMLFLRIYSTRDFRTHCYGKYVPTVRPNV